MIPGNPVVGSTVLRRPAIQSPDYVTGAAGWSINASGSAEFNNVTIRGTLEGPDYIINSAGIYFYSGTPAAGNLILASVSAIGTDPFGNSIPNPGITSFFNSGSGYISLNTNGGALSWATAASESGPWTTQGEIGINISDPTTLIVDFAAWETPP